MRVESEKYFIKAENASPSHRDIDAEVFFLSGKRLRPSNELLAGACQIASRRDKIMVVSKAEITEGLVRNGIKEQIAKKMAESLETGSAISLITGFCNGPFVAIIERPELAESLQLPYRIKWAAIS